LITTTISYLLHLLALIASASCIFSSSSFFLTYKVFHENGHFALALDTLRDLPSRHVVFSSSLSSGFWAGHYLDLERHECSMGLWITVKDNVVNGKYSLTYQEEIGNPHEEIEYTDTGLVEGKIDSEEAKLTLHSLTVKRLTLHIEGKCQSAFMPAFTGTLKDDDQRVFTTGNFMLWKH
jgi:hypothetical protein